MSTEADRILGNQMLGEVLHKKAYVISCKKNKIIKFENIENNVFLYLHLKYI